MSAPINRAKQALLSDRQPNTHPNTLTDRSTPQTVQGLADSITGATDDLLDGLFGDLETTALQDNPYPYVGTRPPLLRQGGWSLDKALMVGTGTIAVAVLLLWQGSRWWRMEPTPFSSNAAAPAVEEGTGALWPGSPSQLAASDLAELATETDPQLLADSADSLVNTDSLINQDGLLLTSDQGSPVPQLSGGADTSPSPQQPQPEIRSATPTPPPQPVAAAVVPPPAPILGAPAGIQLVGILRAPGDPVALMIANGQTHQAGVGAAVTGWQVMSITPHSVVISNGSQSRVLQISLGGG